MPELLKPFYTVNELADLLEVKPITIYRRARAGEITHHLIGRAIRFSRQDVEAYLGSVRVAVEAK